MPRISVWLSALAALVLLGCGSSSKKPVASPTAAPTPAPVITIARGQPIIIAVSAALTGDQQSLGNDIADAADLAISDHGPTLRGHPLQIKRMDDRCTDAEKAAAVARSLAAETTLAGVKIGRAHV